ncbi:AAA family ATPase [Pseudoalteromonas sp. JBTF-M23]|uniref:AAA family ATPase n=1 Tax=Pseudoalteromonas caenipelagi TaxID=2726988 RepID=A0A849VB79_9GAMM|nr:AAA family ATPase [Pseudoalteromonas caenipelagi]NOU49067.1 AAA family ATPase [Pseudoalteromonas caenipelagi]
MLYIFGGLPGTGKSELSKYLSETIGAVYLRIDTIEQTLKNHAIKQIYDEGYQVASTIASENLKLGQSVVADSTNPVNESRELWRNTAISASAQFIEIEIICSDLKEHKQRIETRVSDIPELQLPTWKSVIEREYHQWTTERVVVDTAGRTLEQSKHVLMNAIGLSARAKT